MKRIYILLTFLISLQSIAQESKHEYSLYGAGIFNKMNYELRTMESKLGNGIELGVGYRYYLNQKWSIGTGLEYQTYQSEIVKNHLSDSYQMTDLEGDIFEFRYTATNYKEEHKAQYLAIPLTIQYETGNVVKWYASMGAKVGFELSSEYRTTIDHLKTSGYFSQWNVELQDPEFMGFGTWEKIDAGAQDMELKTLFMITVETGLKQRINETNSLYFGFYLDYGLNDLLPENKGENLIQYNTQTPKDFTYNSLVFSQKGNRAYAEKLNLMSFGFKLRWAFRR